MDITDAQLQSWIQSLLFPLARIAGLLVSAPVLGDASAPARVRLMLALALTLILAPLLPAGAPLAAFTAAWWLRMAQETLLGVMIGFVLKLVFESVMLGGELIGSSMGLGFARMADPLRGTDAPVIGHFLNLMATLLFISMQGPLRLIELLATSFTTAPDAATVLTGANFAALASAGASVFAGAVSLALPTMAALLLVNLAFGVMSRAAPTLNGLSVGFPLSLAAGMLLLRVDLPSLREVFTQGLDRGWLFVAGLIGSTP